jgi:hypothetical protein
MNSPTDQEKEYRRQLERLAEALAEDVLETPDEEFLVETKERGETLNELARRGQDAVLRGIAESKRRKLAAARSDYKAAAGGGRSNVVALPIGDKRRILAQVAANDPGLRAKLTLAARSAEAGEISENDLDSLLEDLRDLGVIDENGNPK